MSQEQLREQAIGLLNQFGQIILHGPPGTGKTRLAREVAAEMPRVDAMRRGAILMSVAGPRADIIDTAPQFAIVQFHPAYNYEDFVRGIQVKTDDNNNVAYQTVNRVFGEFAKRAAKNRDPHVIVIDEINRANVSAVLGELIYGLEYRGKKIQTPYQVDGDAGLIIPDNLFVIGTMNTADRTIGQIDYAVRRRFAFLRCPPDESVVEKHGGPRAPEFFQLTDEVFEHLSADHDKEDVCIGHSYFLADGIELANKIIYQVVPILREYVKDGVLKREANKGILEIERKAREVLEIERKAQEDLDSAPMPADNGSVKWVWEHKSGEGILPISLRRAIWSLVEDYSHRNNVYSLEELQKDFPNDCAFCCAVALDKNDSRAAPRRFFTRKPIKLGDNTEVVVCSAWSKAGHAAPHFERFRKRAKKFGYKLLSVDPKRKMAVKRRIRKKGGKSYNPPNPPR